MLSVANNLAPTVQGLILGSTGKKGKVTALIDSDDVHCLMIGASGVGKTASGGSMLSVANNLALDVQRPTA